MYIKCTRVASKRGITDDGRHAESRCTRLYLLLREKTNSCRACIATRFARPPTPEKNSSRITRSRSTRSLIPSSIYVRVCACVTYMCIEYLAKLVLEKIEFGTRAERGRSIFYCYFFYDNLVQRII